MKKAAWELGTRLSAVAAALALALGGVLVWEWEQARQLERDLLKLSKIPVTPVPALQIEAEFGLPDVTTGFPELLARPIFAAGRRPLASANQGGPSAMKKGQFALVGVVITPNQHSALLRDVESNKTETVTLGGQIRGLTLGDVEPGRVVLRLGGDSEELLLKVQLGASPSPSVPPQAQPLVPPLPQGLQPGGARPVPPPWSALSAPLPVRAPPSVAEQEQAYEARASKIAAQLQAAQAKKKPAK